MVVSGGLSQVAMTENCCWMQVRKNFLKEIQLHIKIKVFYFS